MHSRSRPPTRRADACGLIRMMRSSKASPGLDACGFLLLRQDNGTVTKILAGGVRPI